MKIKTFEGLFLDKDEWTEKIINLIIGYGGTKSDEPGYEWVIDTKVGRLFINLRISSLDKTAFMKFEKPNEAKKLVGCNPNSGKWNILTYKTSSNFFNFYHEFKTRLDYVGLTPIERKIKKFNI